MIDPGPGAWLLAYITAQRLAELALARANTRALIARGAREAGAGHYPAMVALHGAWLAGLWWLGAGNDLITLPLLLYLAVQGLRAWTLASLGRRWTTRIMVVPGETLVARGPYRWLRHPNYWVVGAEVALAPLALGLPLYALAFTLLNAAMTRWRVRAEEAALRAPGAA